MTAIDRLPPHDLEAEEAVVACCLVSPDTIPETAAMLSGADFFCEKNGWIFDAEQAVYNRDGGAGVNQFTVAHELARLNLLEPAGGQAYLADVVRRLPTSLGSEFYAKIVKDTGTMRKLISAGSAIAQLAYRAGDDVAGVLEQAAEIVNRVSLATQRPASQTAAEVLSDGLEDWLEKHLDDPLALAGISSGLRSLDNLLDGFQRGSVYILAAETSAGKSLFVADRLLHLARNGSRCLLFSSEMTNRSVGRRAIFQLAGIDPQRKRREGFYSDAERASVNLAKGEFAGLPLVFVNQASSFAAIRSELRRRLASGPVDVVAIDHVDHVGGGGQRGRTAELEELMRDLKGMAAELDVALIVVSHMSRPSLGGGKMSRLKNSSSKEQDADVVMFLTPVQWIEGQWEEISGEAAQQVKAQQGRVTVRLEVFKNREGMTGYVPLTLDWNMGGRFYPLAKEES